MPIPRGGLSPMVGNLLAEKPVAALVPTVSGIGYGNIPDMILFTLIKQKILAER
jgi:hypothetical protein